MNFMIQTKSIKYVFVLDFKTRLRAKIMFTILAKIECVCLPKRENSKCDFGI